MNTKFPYTGKIDYDAYLRAYRRQEDAITSLPDEGELRETARKAIVKDHLVLESVGADEPAQLGDTVTMAVSSELPKFNKPKVTVSIGRGLYNKALEEAVAGLRIGDAAHLTISDKPVDVTVLDIRRKTAPEPTDEMVVALGQKDMQGKPILTVADYESYVIEEKTLEAIATVNYYVMEKILEDYPMTEYDGEDIRVLGELEREAFHELFLKEEGIDLYTQTKEEMQERWGCDSFDEFIKMRHDWYQMKIQQCLIYLNILGLPCEGETDPLDHYEVLSELTMRIYDMLKQKLSGKEN